MTEEIDGAGTTLQVTTLNVYDNAGQQTSSRDGNGNWSYVQINGVGETTGTTDALRNVSQSNYDLAGQLLASRDQMGRWTTYCTTRWASKSRRWTTPAT